MRIIMLLNLMVLTASAHWWGFWVPGPYCAWDNQSLNPQGDVPPIYAANFPAPPNLPPVSIIDIHGLAGIQGFNKADEPFAWTLQDSFWYYGKWYKPGDKLYISPDGWVSFEMASIAPEPPPWNPIFEGEPWGVIGAYWTDLSALDPAPVNPGDPATVYYKYYPSVKQLVVEWYKVTKGNYWFTFGLVMQLGGKSIVYEIPGSGVIWSGHYLTYIYGNTNATWFTPSKWLVWIDDQTAEHNLTIDGSATTTHDLANNRIVRFAYGRIFRDNVEAFQILSPGKIVLRYTKIEPKVVVRNSGEEIVSFPLTFKIDSISGKTVYGPVSANIVSLAVGALDTVSFACWNMPGNLGAHYRATFVVKLNIDQCPGDDTLKKEIWVGCDDTLAHFPLEPSLWTFGSDSTGMLDGIWYSAPNGALLNGGVLNIAKDVPDNNYGNWSIQVWSSNASGNPNAAVATGLKPASYGSGYNTVAFPSPLWVSTAASGLGSRFWLFYATDALKGKWDEYRLMQPPGGTPQSYLVSGLWYTGPHSFSFPNGPTISSGWYANHYEPLLPPPNPREPVANLIPDLQAITHLALDAPPLPPCYGEKPHDVATVRIDEPVKEYVQAESAYNCKSKIANYGYATESGLFYSHLTIDSATTMVYHESTAVNKIGWFGDQKDNPDSLNITYSSHWAPASGGDMGQGIPYDMSFFVKLGKIGPDATDHCPANDSMKKTVTALWKDDVGVEQITEPSYQADVNAGSSVVVKAEIRNYGYRTEGPFDVELTVWDLSQHFQKLPTDTLVYSTIQVITFLDWRGNASGNPSVVTKSFPAWVVPIPDDQKSHWFLIEVHTFLPNDRYPANDYKSILVLCYIGDIVEKNPSRPNTFDFSAIQSNPFATTAEIRYALPITNEVSLKIYDIAGKLVKTLVDEIQESAFYTVRWDGVDDRGQKVGGGIYILKMETPGYHATKKFVLLRR